MAQKIRVTYSCDIPWGTHDGPVAPVQFALDGITYEADLCQAHSEDMSGMVFPFRLHARPAAPEPRRPQARRRDARAARAWAIAHADELGYTVKPKGQIPKDALRAYARRNERPAGPGREQA